MKQNLEYLFKLQEEIVKWQYDTFSDFSIKSIAIKLHQESEELTEELENFESLGVKTKLNYQHLTKSKLKINYEIADCFILLLSIAKHSGLNPADMIMYAIEKMEINKSREWTKKPDGTFQHVEAEEKKVEDELINKCCEKCGAPTGLTVKGKKICWKCMNKLYFIK